MGRRERYRRHALDRFIANLPVEELEGRVAEYTGPNDRPAGDLE